MPSARHGEGERWRTNEELPVDAHEIHPPYDGWSQQILQSLAFVVAVGGDVMGRCTGEVVLSGAVSRIAQRREEVPWLSAVLEKEVGNTTMPHVPIYCVKLTETFRWEVFSGSLLLTLGNYHRSTTVIWTIPASKSSQSFSRYQIFLLVDLVTTTLKLWFEWTLPVDHTPILYYCSLFITISVCIYYPDVYTSSNEIYPLTQCTRFSENELSQKSFLQLFHIKGAARNTIQASNITLKKTQL
jgi:hypothetical protein